MKRRLIMLVLLVFVLCGCKAGSGEIGGALALRQKILTGSGCSFTSEITADYGNKVYTFTLSCEADRNGNLSFTVISPENISGVSGKISDTGGHLTFDDKALAFETIADGLITPVTAPWLFIKTLRSGYIAACGKDGEHIYLQIDDSYADEALHLDIWTDKQYNPVRAEILWQGKRVLSLTVDNFKIL